MKSLVSISRVFLLLGIDAGVSAFGPSVPRMTNPLAISPALALERSKIPFHVALAMKTGEAENEIPLSESTISSQPRAFPKTVAKVEKFSRLPVWPVWMGVMIFFVSRVFGDKAAAKLEDNFGGRVCPNFFENTQETSPFIMLVHHRHSFWSWDPIRYIQRSLILPEGFPAHPHRGFTTLTYFMKGGFQHRDSLGCEQKYAATNNPYHSQWLFTGAGLLHEEMFDDQNDQELYQLWINVPSYQKLQPPDVMLMGKEECPEIIGDDRSKTVVLAGNYEDGSSKAPIMSDMSIFHVTIESGGSWSYSVPEDFETVILYIRQGSIQIGDDTVPVHHTAYLESIGTQLEVSASKEDGGDFLLLAGRRLNEPVAAQGSMVMNYGDEINAAYRDYQLGYMGQPWDHSLTNEEWEDHLKKFPSRYRYDGQERSN